MKSQGDGKFIDMGLKFDGAKAPTKAKTEALAYSDCAAQP